jgi:hypothetical protein
MAGISTSAAADAEPASHADEDDDGDGTSAGGRGGGGTGDVNETGGAAQRDGGCAALVDRQASSERSRPVYGEPPRRTSPPLLDLLPRSPDLCVEEGEVHGLGAATGTSSSATAAAAIPRPEAVGRGGDGSDEDDGDTCPFIELIQRHPELFEKEVLERLDPADRAFLGQVDAACRAAVVTSDLPCAGTRVGMRQSTPAECDRLARRVRAMPLGYLRSSDVPRRAGGGVRLELMDFCTSPERLAWAKEKGCRWDGWTCALAARGGHLDSLRWAREHGCLWSSRTCRYAAEGGHLVWWCRLITVSKPELKACPVSALDTKL